jgi:UDP-2,3-diacylglucosamine hydrolase
MNRLFISDLHLGTERPASRQAFMRFLATHTHPGDELYILGDLFDAWLGDDDESSFAQSVVDALAARTRAGVRICLMPGNRDLLLGARFAERVGATLLPDPCCRSIEGQRVLLAHGDALCSADHGYQRYRRFIRSPLTRRLLMTLPVAVRRRIAARLRRSSRTHTAAKPTPLLDVVPATVDDALLAHHARLLIHGHTHRPARHVHTHGTRLVLGDWDGSIARYVHWPAGGEAQLLDFDIDAQAPSCERWTLP